MKLNYVYEVHFHDRGDNPNGKHWTGRYWKRKENARKSAKRYVKNTPGSIAEVWIKYAHESFCLEVWK